MTKLTSWITIAIIFIGIAVASCGVDVANDSNATSDNTTFDYTTFEWSESANQTISLPDNVTAYSVLSGGECGCVPRNSTILLSACCDRRIWVVEEGMLNWCDEDCDCPPAFISIYCSCEDE